MKEYFPIADSFEDQTAEENIIQQVEKTIEDSCTGDCQCFPEAGIDILFK